MPPERRTLDLEASSLRAVLGVLAAVALVFLIAPTLIVLLTSLTAGESLKFPPDGLSLRWYRELADADQMRRAAWNSLVVGVWATLLCIALGTPAAIAIARSDRPWARALDVLFMSPLVLPAMAFGFAAL